MRVAALVLVALVVLCRGESDEATARHGEGDDDEPPTLLRVEVDAAMLDGEGELTKEALQRVKEQVLEAIRVRGDTADEADDDLEDALWKNALNVELDASGSGGGGGGDGDGEAALPIDEETLTRIATQLMRELQEAVEQFDEGSSLGDGSSAGGEGDSDGSGGSTPTIDESESAEGEEEATEDSTAEQWHDALAKYLTELGTRPRPRQSVRSVPDNNEDRARQLHNARHAHPVLQFERVDYGEERVDVDLASFAIVPASATVDPTTGLAFIHFQFEVFIRHGVIREEDVVYGMGDTSEPDWWMADEMGEAVARREGGGGQWAEEGRGFVPTQIVLAGPGGVEERVFVFAEEHLVDGDGVYGMYDVTWEFSGDRLPAGEWRVVSVFVRDAEDMEVVFEGADLSASGYMVQLYVLGSRIDIAPPQLLRLALPPDRRVVTYASPSRSHGYTSRALLTLLVEIVDDLSGLQQDFGERATYLTMSSVDILPEQSLTAYLDPVFDKVAPNIYEWKIELGDMQSVTAWRVRGIRVCDRAGNYRDYDADEVNALLEDSSLPRTIRVVPLTRL